MLVEGTSDEAAVRTLAGRRGLDLTELGVDVAPIGEATNIRQFLERAIARGLLVTGLCDAGDAPNYRWALQRASLGIDLGSAGFFVCTADLEDELIRADGTATVKQVLDVDGDRESFHRFQQQPAQRGRPLHQQLRRFMGTRSAPGGPDPSIRAVPLCEWSDRTMWNARGMTVLGELARASGSWEGTNGFRLMPTDELAVAPATATVDAGAGGHVVTLGYTWSYPDDGPQQGLLAVGHTEDGHAAVAFWSDSWHQPAVRILAATLAARGLSFEYEYAGGWRWQVMVALESDELGLRMLNVIPQAEADGQTSVGAYEAMVMDLRREG